MVAAETRKLVLVQTSANVQDAGNEGNSSSVGSQGNVQNLINTWFQLDPVDLPWELKVSSVARMMMI